MTFYKIFLNVKTSLKFYVEDFVKLCVITGKEPLICLCSDVLVHVYHVDYTNLYVMWYYRLPMEWKTQNLL